jgi:SAM-dependent methyltransferase
VAADERRLQWDVRHQAGDFEGEGPNPSLIRGVSELPRGTALELAAGSGTNAVWLAAQGWRVTAVDWSPVGLANGRAKAQAAGVAVDWLERDLFAWSAPERSFDLVIIVYLHLPPEERRIVYGHAAAAVAPGGRLLVVGHHPLNATEGVGGPPDTTRLISAEDLGAELMADDPGLELERAEVVRHAAAPVRAPIDSLLVIRRRPAAQADPAPN